jgi:chromosome segregation ATPase
MAQAFKEGLTGATFDRQGHPPPGPGPLHSEFATVSNELRTAKAEFNHLVRQQQRSQTRHEELQHEVRALRAEREALERQAALAQRVAEAALAEREELAAAAAGSKAYAHRLETRLALQTPPEPQHEAAQRLKSRQLREQRDAAVAEAAAAAALCRCESTQ